MLGILDVEMVVAPNEEPSRHDKYDVRPRVFMAGGITGCPDWQRESWELYRERHDHPAVFLNPRRDAWDINAPASEAQRQIQWEHRMLRHADVILFWFPAETLCPIVLFELGAWSMTGKPIAVGTHVNYQRRFDVVEQLALARPDVTVVATALDELMAHATFLIRKVSGRRRV